MAAEPLEPVSIDAVFERLRDRMEAFEAAFRQGPVGAQQVVDLWESSLELKVESEEFYQFLLKYRTILNGLLWAHYPEEYREKVYPRLQEAGFSEGNLLEMDSPKRQPKMMLVVAEEVFSSRENEALSIPDLIEEMKARGVQFTAKDPAKSLAQAMKNSGRFETARRGMYRLKKS
jgi:hypothetical protein